MQNIRSSGTVPEQIIMTELRKRKIYFARNVKTITGKPDIVFRRKKLAVFIDSDFWHGHPKRFAMPKTNINYWKNKIQKNKERDKLVNRTLRRNGWKIIRIWEHDAKKHTSKCIYRIIRKLNQ